MSNKYLFRDDAPFDSAIWERMDKIMIQNANALLTGRKLLHLQGPLGVGVKGVPLADKIGEDGLSVPGFLPLIEFRVNFSLNQRDIAAFEHDGLNFPASAVAKATREAATREEMLIFKGTDNAPGLLKVKGVQKIKCQDWKSVGMASEDVIKALTAMDETGVFGPFALALAPNLYNKLYRLYSNGPSELEHLKTMVTDGIVKAPYLEKGGVLVATGKPYVMIVVGQDMSIGYIGPSATEFEFFISESMALHIRHAKAICVLEV